MKLKLDEPARDRGKTSYAKGTRFDDRWDWAAWECPFSTGPTDDAENIRVLHRYLALGGNFLDTAEVYGPYTGIDEIRKF